VVTQAEGACLVLAGAGSGKTRTLIYRVAYLLEKGIHPEEILLVTFTNKAANEMRHRVELLLKTKAKGLWCGTFHHIGNRILRMHSPVIGFSNDFGILDEEDSRDLLKTCLKSVESHAMGVRFPKPSVVKSILSFSVNAQKKVSETVQRQYPYLTPFVTAFERVQTIYLEKKKQTNHLDYDDLLLRWMELLQTSEEVRGKLSQRFRYCLVDEYQDTNRLQHTIIRLLSGHHRNVLVVGDDAQSIYSFRAADVKNILDFPEDYPEAKIFKLETNYRSTVSILDLANHSIEHNVRQFPKKLKSIREEGFKPQLVRVRDGRQEAAFVAQRILETEEAGIDFSEIAVLFRAHYLAAELELELAKRGVDYIVRGGIRFFELAHVKDVLACLRILASPKNEIAWVRALTLQPGIGFGYADKIFQASKKTDGSLHHVVDAEFGREFPPRVREGLQSFKKILKDLVPEERKDHPDMLIEAVLENGYTQHVLLNFENARDRLEDLKQLVNFAHTYKSLKEFLADVTLREGFRGETIVEAEAEQSLSTPLVLSTIHQAKGLEWKAVFVIGLSEGQFPHAKSLANEEQLEEERRLFYVACTRAKEQLILTHPMMRYDSQVGTVINKPSPFIAELSPDLYDEVEVEEGRNEETIYIDENQAE
jgi:DNA helicase-2/ATP-dependent DNA helicase PcrA